MARLAAGVVARMELPSADQGCDMASLAAAVATWENIPASYAGYSVACFPAVRESWAEENPAEPRHDEACPDIIYSHSDKKHMVDRFCL